jgi:hypothetical protein
VNTVVVPSPVNVCDIALADETLAAAVAQYVAVPFDVSTWPAVPVDELAVNEPVTPRFATDID